MSIFMASPVQSSKAYVTADIPVGNYVDIKDDWVPSVKVAGILPTADTDQAATRTTVRGILWDDNELVPKDFVITLYMAHPLRFRRIYRTGTTCTSFIMLAQ